MKRIAALVLLGLLAACTNPQVGATVGFGAGGASISPSLSGQFGRATLSFSG